MRLSSTTSQGKQESLQQSHARISSRVACSACFLPSKLSRHLFLDFFITQSPGIGSVWSLISVGRPERKRRIGLILFPCFDLLVLFPRSSIDFLLANDLDFILEHSFQGQSLDRPPVIHARKKRKSFSEMNKRQVLFFYQDLHGT
jgi:hypothetical protein